MALLRLDRLEAGPRLMTDGRTWSPRLPAWLAPALGESRLRDSKAGRLQWRANAARVRRPIPTERTSKVSAPVLERPSARCAWANPKEPLYVAYHDEEWGVPEYDSRALWEKLVLDGFQAGLAWITILGSARRSAPPSPTSIPRRVARFGEADRARLMADAGIVRSNAKIDAAIAGARIYLDMREAGEDFAAFLWDFVGGEPIQNRWIGIGQVPAQTPEAVEMAKALKAKGFKFCGPVIVYAFMQAVGMVNDHVTDVPAPRGEWPLWPPPDAKAGPTCGSRGPVPRRSAASTRPGAGPGPGRSAPRR